MNSSTQIDVAVLIGRFQPFHNGHATLLQLALETAEEVVIVLGSSFHARSTKNPFTWQERADMIRATLSQSERDRISFVAVRDYYDDARWARAVRAKVEHLCPYAKRVALIGHFKDASSYYLNRFPQWQLVAAEQLLAIDATIIRKVLFEAEDMRVSLDVITHYLPASIRQYLKAWSILPQYADLVREHAQLQAYQAAWKPAPYPPIFSTVDAVVKAADHVLLVQRGGFPGKGLWAIPGGFLDQNERLFQGAIRELFEETNLAVLSTTLENALQDVKVFDHPGRSLRGRTITHAHFFDLQTDHLPDIRAADDAAQAAWVSIDKITAMEEAFFDDHFHILDQFLMLTADE
ncbi:bifunctional nicotinamide-nucleotide adenylyltransferase/Nudix hydroxylase [Undibacterium sp. TS12]|uniref:bifunctional nicotinamide-nucleotide adenylyltransferase/Nudix hydroxylase n=1 Tax=Undibacterium sp. TS12 TaxID=2908202 RepID=UPI001F4C63CC|nr:bifunctional nicotinamide-nucleotide adenylyltransferase/Nudix hydroxylase [Undibacterium sp. TS12]MCH8617873.1 bifunctional nicotinamide-nucleotide adenylyltransferase/Nudix hydroxylase [Undibacterium sp. TS12]